MRKILLLLVLICPLVSTAQILKKATWQYHLEPANPKAGEEAELVFDIDIAEDWYVYSTDFDPDLGPLITSFTFEANDTYEVVGDIQPVGQKKKYDDLWEGDYTYFVKKGQFRQKVKILDDNFTIKGSYEYQVCSEIDGKCILQDDDFEASGGTGAAAKQAPKKIKIKQIPQENQPQDNGETDTAGDEQSIFLIILAGFGFGISAVLMPCIYPLIPITISIFIKQSSTRAEGIKKALVYGGAIIVLFLLIGFIVSAIWGVTALNELSTHWLFNLILFALFVAFGLSLLGLFEIQLPNSMVNAIDKQADRGGYIGIFFMAITLVVVSFSCTVPIVGAALVSALSEGKVIYGIFSMLGFALAFAIPFTCFALFPNLLKSLPKSGGWLTTLKVFLGFIELAAAMKFLSVADLAYHWGILDRDVFLALWIMIFAFLGFYLLGKIRFPKDGDDNKVPVPRMMVALFTFAFVMYLIPGLWGAPLKPLAGLLPPMHTLDYQGGGAAAEVADPICETPKYSDILHAPHGIPAYFEFEQAMACAKASNKPLFIDFTGHGCVNCREMEATVWSDKEVLKRLKNDFVVVELYVDDRTALPEDEWVVSTYDQKVKKTIGKKNADFQVSQFKNNAQPYYIVLGHDDLTPLVKPKAFDRNVANFVAYLDNAKRAFQNK